MKEKLLPVPNPHSVELTPGTSPINISPQLSIFLKQAHRLQPFLAIRDEKFVQLLQKISWWQRITVDKQLKLSSNDQTILCMFTN